MSLDIRCPNCGAIVGTMNHTDYYTEKYFYKGKNDKPICNICNTNVYNTSGRNVFLISIISIIIFLLILYIIS